MKFIKTILRYAIGLTFYIGWRIRLYYASTRRVIKRADDAALHVEWETYRQEDLADKCYKRCLRHKELYEASPFRNGVHRAAYHSALAAGDHHRDAVFDLRRLKHGLEAVDASERLRALREYSHLKAKRKDMVLL